MSLSLLETDLFPDNPNASKDEKCIIILQVIQQITNKLIKEGMQLPTQKELISHVNKRYEYLCQKEKLSLDKVDHAAFLLWQMGVDVNTAKKYYSMRLNDEDAQKWTIKIV